MHFHERFIGSRRKGYKSIRDKFLSSSGLPCDKHCGPCIGNLFNQAEHINKIKTKMTSILAANTGKPFEQVAKDVERDYYMSAQEALEYGLIDKIFEKRG